MNLQGLHEVLASAAAAQLSRSSAAWYRPDTGSADPTRSDGGRRGPRPPASLASRGILSAADLSLGEDTGPSDVVPKVDDGTGTDPAGPEGPKGTGGDQTDPTKQDDPTKQSLDDPTSRPTDSYQDAISARLAAPGKNVTLALFLAAGPRGGRRVLLLSPGCTLTGNSSSVCRASLLEQRFRVVPIWYSARSSATTDRRPPFHGSWAAGSSLWKA